MAQRIIRQKKVTRIVTVEEIIEENIIETVQSETRGSAERVLTTGNHQITGNCQVSTTGNRRVSTTGNQRIDNSKEKDIAPDSTNGNRRKSEKRKSLGEPKKIPHKKIKYEALGYNNDTDDECQVVLDTRFRRILVPTSPPNNSTHAPNDGVSNEVENEDSKTECEVLFDARDQSKSIENQNVKELEMVSPTPRYSKKSEVIVMSDEEYKEYEEELEKQHQKLKESMETSESPSFTYEEDYEVENFHSRSFSTNEEQEEEPKWINPAKRRLVFEDEKKTSASYNHAYFEEASNSLVWKCMMGWLEQGNKAYREKYNVRVPYNYIKSNANSSNANSSNGNSSKTTNIINKNNSQNNSSNVSEPNNSNITENEEDEVTILYYSKDSQ